MARCECYHTQFGFDKKEYGVCYGTKEQEICDCDGNRARCTYYPDVREKAVKQNQVGDVFQRKYVALFVRYFTENQSAMDELLDYIAKHWDEIE